ncbi:MAG TPA: SMC-Scp complex subunit ScpB [Acidobacteriaceae bacterium]|jgi:segregation and condensation protein B|nr:SMC-Scp complex subunit ScpB [Acidobacteriaceae bacterium]
MSLKAKIEAVIYAAEEPVTLAQIASLFQAELLDERTARLSAEAAPAEETATEEPALDLENVAEQSKDVPLESPESAEDAEKRAAEDEKKAARQRDREVRDEARRVISGLIAEYNEGDRGMEIREIAGGYRVATKPEYHDAVRAFVKSLKPPMKLSLQALETLAVIAYKQPVTAPEVSEIRGVDSGGVLGSLVSRKLITTAGRKQVIGRPILYKTTKEFLLRFGLKDLNELPSIEEFEKMAGELAETEDNVSASDLPFEESAVVEAAVASESDAEPDAESAEAGGE